VKGQLIFTGNMDFPPNYQSALWFIDEVFPLLKKSRRRSSGNCRCESGFGIGNRAPVIELL
jgi:hypothetical protein